MHVPRVVDADGHCQEPEEGLAQWMPKELASRAPRRVTDNLGRHPLVQSERVGPAGRVGLLCQERAGHCPDGGIAERHRLN